MSRRKFLIGSIGVLLLVASATALGPLQGPARLLKDINSSPTMEAGAFPDQFVAFGAISLFTANTPEHGLELWRTDGTGAGTYLLKDIRPGAEGSGPSGLIGLGGVVYFHADDGANGDELWRTDGTKAGTTLVTDIRPGPAGSIASFAAFKSFRGRLFFGADDGVRGMELWASDGTAAGTVLIKEVQPNPGAFGRVESMLAEIDGALLFTAGEPVHGFELWRTDGTEAGTFLVKDIRPGTSSSVPGSGASWTFTPVEMGGVLYFQALDGTHGLEVWRSNGTEEGTVLVKDIDPRPGLDRPVLATAGGILFVSVDDQVHGRELWRSDGTVGGTVLVKDIVPNAGGSSPESLTEFQGDLYFQASDPQHGRELWKSDGTEAGTVLVRDVRPGPPGSQFFDPFQQLVAVGGTLFFASDDGDHGIELWKTDGTRSGTVLVEDIRPGLASSIRSFGFGPHLRTGTLHGTLLFGADEGLHGHELWRSDGTAAGTQLVKDVNPFYQTDGAGGNRLGVIDGVLFFSTNDGVHGTELWRTDGTAAGTVMVKDINPGPGDSSPGGVVVGKTLFFVAFEPTHGRELWKSDGTEEGTVLVRDIAGFEQGFPLSSSPRQFAATDGLLFFHANDRIHGDEPWRSDGTEAGTFLLRDVEPGPFSSGAAPSVALGETVLFAATTAEYGRELWRSDGTEAGTTVLDIVPGSGSSLGETNFTVIDGVLYFPATDGVHGLELWRTDGTQAGTRMVRDVLDSPQALLFRARTVLDGTIYFVSDEFNSHAALWKTDGSEAGTVLVKSAIRPVDRFYYTRLASVGETLLFNADDGVHGVELWKSDGTEEGTVLLKDINPGSADSINALGSQPFFIEVGGSLFFVADDGSHGPELWSSDGTEAGTRLVRDIVPGAESSNPIPLATLDETLFFRADDGVHGQEPWRTDGTEEGTAIMQDIAPGTESSFATFLLDEPIAGARGVFRADDGVTGLELWIGRAAILANQPRRAVEDLRSELQGVHLPIGLERVVARTLERASNALAQPGGGSAAIAELRRFAHWVEKLSPALISDADRADLLDFAGEIVALLEQSAP